MSLYPISTACPKCGASARQVCKTGSTDACDERWIAAGAHVIDSPTTNPETAGVEPVAWMIRSTETKIPFWGFVTNHYRSEGEAAKSAQSLYAYEPFALYAHPPAAPDWNAAATTLTDGLPGDAFVLAREDGLWSMRTLAAWQNLNPPAAREDAVEAVAELQLAAFLAGRGSTRSNSGAPSMDDWRSLATTALSTPEQAPDQDDEVKRDCWSMFEDEHLTDGKGHATAETYRRCQEAFDAAWPKGASDAIRAALAAMPTPAAIRAETTARIVAWLHKEKATLGSSSQKDAVGHYARRIANGHHLTGGGE